MVPGANQMIGGRLGGAVGAVRLVGMGLGERRVIGGQRAIDLVGRDMQEAKGGMGLGRISAQARPVVAGGFEQHEGAVDIGAQEGLRAVDRPVDMAFGGKVDDRAGPMPGQQAVDQRTVGDVAAHEVMAGIALERCQVFEVAGISQGIEAGDRLADGTKPFEHEVGTDETCSAGDENHGGNPCGKQVADQNTRHSRGPGT